MTRRERAAESRTGWLFVAPALLLIGIFFAIPVLGAFVLSFTDFDIYSVGDFSSTRFIGFDNYVALMDNTLF